MSIAVRLISSLPSHTHIHEASAFPAVLPDCPVSRLRQPYHSLLSVFSSIHYHNYLLISRPNTNKRSLLGIQLSKCSERLYFPLTFIYREFFELLTTIFHHFSKISFRRIKILCLRLCIAFCDSLSISANLRPID